MAVAVARRVRRAELATTIRDNTDLDGFTIYPSPPETLSSPSVVIGPGRPYQYPGTLGYDLIGLRLTITVPRMAGMDALDTLDDTLDAIQAAVQADPNWSWAEVQAAGETIEIGGSKHLAAIADVFRDL